MIATGIRMTADDLLRLPDNGMRHELIAGELYEMPPAGGEHGFVGGTVFGRLRIFLDQHPEIGGGLFAAETGFRLARDPDTVRAPDVAYVREANLPRARVRGYPDLAPDFVVEVVSPNDTAAEIESKVQEWLRAGVVLVWVLYPSTQTVMAHRADGILHRLHGDEMLDADPVLPGFACLVAELF
jgi:Uma2 family endonuclease